MIGDHKKELTQKNGLFLKNKSVPKLVYVKDGEIDIKPITTDTLSNLSF